MTDQSLSRRGFLSAGAVALAAGTVAGCNTVSGDGDGGTARSLALSLSREDGPLRERHVLQLSEDQPEWDLAAFRAARDGENYTTQYRTPFFSSPEDPTYVRDEGTYYQLGSVVVGEVSTTHPVLRLSGVERSTVSGETEPVSSDALPRSDQRAVRVGYFAARARGNVGGVPSGLVQRGGYVYRHEESLESSELLADDGPEYVTYRETVYEVEISRERFHEPVYRGTAEPVAETPEEMEAVLRATFVDARFSREDISGDARDVLREAETEGYGESHPYSAAYREVLRALHQRVYVDGNVEKDAGVDPGAVHTILYDGDYFDYRLWFESGG